MELPVFIHAADNCELGRRGHAYIPVSAWLELVRNNRKLRSKSSLLIKTKDRSYLVNPLPAQTAHAEHVEVYDAIYFEERNPVTEGKCILDRVWDGISLARVVNLRGQEKDLITRNLLVGRIIMQGYKIDFGGQTVEFSSIEPDDQQPLFCTDRTIVNFMTCQKPLSTNSGEFHDAGAYRQIEEIILASRRSSRARPIPRGILLHGPPGVGKTHVVRVVCDKLKASVTVINGPEVINSELGQSEENLRSAFLKALKGGDIGVMFIDEIDSIAGKRDDGEQHQIRLLAQLLMLIDYYGGQLVIIGATNRPNAIDPALRRPGRLDREIYIDPPNEELRGKIIRPMLGDYPFIEGLTIDHIAKHTIGYVPADLAALCREILLIALKSGIIDFYAIEKALASIGPSINREYRIQHEKGIDWEDIGGMSEIKLQLQRVVEWPLVHRESFRRLGLRPPRGVLLHGPPGCSKTTIAKVLANSNNFKFYSLSGAAIYSAFVGEAERLIRQVFSCARMTAPSLIFIDELDALVGKRNNDADIVQERVLSTLLNEMDGIEEIGQIVILGATNRKDAIDAALLRPGRFDILIEIPLPSYDDRLAILKTVGRKIPISDDVDFYDIALATDGCSGADLKSVLQMAALSAIRRMDGQVHSDDIKNVLYSFNK